MQYVSLQYCGMRSTFADIDIFRSAQHCYWRRRRLHLPHHGRPRLDFIDGFAFLERFYHVFDVTNSQVGFATTEFTDATTN